MLFVPRSLTYVGKMDMSTAIDGRYNVMAMD